MSPAVRPLANQTETARTQAERHADDSVYSDGDKSCSLVGSAAFDWELALQKPDTASAHDQACHWLDDTTPECVTARPGGRQRASEHDKTAATHNRGSTHHGPS